jgi:anti-anti-sigma regulatory factor
VIVDLTATVFCDASGMRQLLLAHRRAKACHAQVRFAIPHREVLGVLEVTELDRLLSVTRAWTRRGAQGRHRTARNDKPPHPMSRYT